ncbi:MAG TPA: prolyl oligopeptidase family serine peptidase, partial [Terriglobia bacterium]|nr:prolyl oligopeptidase family serine peptidase [Terriglobia bacterium]
MKLTTFALLLSLAWIAATQATPQVQRNFTVEQILSFPSPENLVASPTGTTIAWTFNERGVRNVYVAEGPAFEARKITTYTDDDGQELTQLSFSNDGRTLVYVRGGDHGGRPGDAAPNPAGDPVQPRVQIWSVGLGGGAPRLIGEGDSPAIAPDNARVAFTRERRIWIAPIDGSRPAQQAFYARGTSDSPIWSPDGQTLAFVSDRTDHSFIGLFTPGRAIRFIAPSTSRDSMPLWSPDGKRIAFLRQPGVGGTPQPPLKRIEAPWAILVADVSGAGGPDAPVPAVTVQTSGTPIDPIVQNPGGIGTRWAGNDTLVFLSYRAGFPHVYALDRPATGGKPRLLTPGSFMVEQMTLSADRRSVIYSANTGTNKDDIARRHLFKVPVDGSAAPVALTSGMSIEWSPVVTGDNQIVAFLAATAQRPPAPAVIPIAGGTPRTLGLNRLPGDFPSAQLVTPQQVSFRASDGVEAHGQLFLPSGGPARKPAVVYIHGGGPRQMLLGWHNRWEYANDYGANQYLVSRGFIVLSVDYRLSVGYGQAFQFPENTGIRGASEYRDVLAAGKYLQSRPDVDPAKIGVWGASLGGYLTALALGRNSDVFAAGVDVHGVHDRLQPVNTTQLAHALVGDGITESDLKQALKVQFESSPISAIPTWKSPVLLIHGDDDRIVEFRQSIDLKRRLEGKGVIVEELVLPDDVHDSL